MLPARPLVLLVSAFGVQHCDVARQEGEHGALELVLALDHRPVPAVVEHVQFALGG